MEEIKKIIENDDYFRGKKYKLIPIQKWNKKHKFLMEIDNQKYMLIIGNKKVEKYKIRFLKLGSYFQNLVGLQYLNDEGSLLLHNYYGNGEGKPLSCCNLSVDENKIVATKLKVLLDGIHKHKEHFINFSTHFECNSWYDFIYSYMHLYANYALEHHDLTEEDYHFIFALLEKEKSYFDSVPLNYLHGDINEDNVCFNQETKEVYLIDYDDFLIGDTLYEYARMFQYEKIPAFKIIKEEYYSKIEDNIIFLIYQLRNYLLGYCFEKENGFSWENSLENFYRILDKLKKMENNNK